MQDMNDNVAVIEKNPSSILLSFNGSLAITQLGKRLIDGVYDRSNLVGRVTSRYYEVVCD